MAGDWFSAPAPASKRVRAYFAPVDRTANAPTIFDPAEQGTFDLDDPPLPWISLGWIQEFTRTPASIATKIVTGVPAAMLEQVRETVAAEVSFQFLSWTKLTMALATGSQHMNLLAAQVTSAPRALGGKAVPAVDVQSGSTATSLLLSNADAAGFEVGTMVAVDADYAGQTGFVGVPVAGAYVRSALDDVDYTRRVTFNVGLVTQVSSTALTLAAPLPGGTPASGAKVQALRGFVDREGGSFYQEWSGLFVIEGSQRERIFFHYPRLQSSAGAVEVMNPLDGRIKSGYTHVLLKGQYTALSVIDPLDGEKVVCYRSFFPAPNAVV